MSIDLERQKLSALVLANAGELITGVIREVSGNDISSSINGSKLTGGIINSIAFQRIGKVLDQNLKLA